MSGTVKSVHPRMVFGFALVAIGFLFLLDQFLPYRFHLHDFWPLLLVIWGLARFSSHDARGWGVSSALVIFGVFFLLEGYEPFSYIFNWDNLWPLALIALGGYLITKNLNQRNRGIAGDSSVSADNLRASVFVGSRKIAVSSANFSGGTAIVALGGLEIDLRDAQLSSQAPEVVIDVTTTLGGVELIVPDEWNVVLRASVILGGIEDKRRRAAVARNQGTVLVIDGVVLLGGVEVLSVRKNGL